MSKERAILILDMSYSLATFNELGLFKALESRRLGGYFSKVISVHPLEFLQERTPAFGPPVITRLVTGDLFVSGRRGPSGLLRHMPPLNFLISQVQLFLQVLNLCKVHHVQVVRIGDPYYLGILGILFSRALSIPLVIRVCANYDEFVKVTGRPMMPRLFRYRWIEKFIERFVFPRCDLIAGANEDNLLYAIANGGSSCDTAIFRYGNLLHPEHWISPINRSRVDSILSELGLLGYPFTVTVARLEKLKRIDHVLSAIALLKKRGVSLHCLIIGDGSERKALEATAAEIGVGEQVRFVGSRSQEWIARVLPYACAAAAPHMGRALVEAALAGIPLVAYDFDWQRELVRDGVNGFLVPDGSVKEMADRLAIIVDDPMRGKSMGEQSRAIAFAMMNNETLESHERRAYERLLSRFHK